MKFKFSLLVIMMVAVAAMRIPNAAQLTLWSNFTPIGAMALFGGACFNERWKAFLFPLATLFVSDIIINTIVHQGRFGVMYDGWYWVYLAFVLITVIGRLIIKKISVVNVVLASVLGTLCHWLVADFSVWISGGTDLRTMQPLSRDFSGLVQCYLQGLPYMKNFLLGTLAYSAVLFGIYHYMKYDLRSATFAQSNDRTNRIS